MSLSRARARRDRPMLRGLSALAVALFVAACGSSSPSGPPSASSAPSSASPAAAPWLDASLPVDQRVSALLAQMTLDEKIGQMTQVENRDPNAGYQMRDPGQVATGLFGSVLSGGDGNPTGQNDAQNWYDMVNQYQQAALRTRLRIPILYGVDAIHGDAHLTGTTVFPHNVGLGATRDPALVKQVCQVTAAEMNATGVRWTFAPVIAVPQDVRWGRTYEGYGENTDLVSQLGVACLEGYQGASLSDPGTVVADPKHFLGDGGTAYVANSSGQYMLDQGVDQLDDATIENLFLPPYKQAVDNGARIIMASFSSIQNEGKMTGNQHWLTDVLKTQLGFSGFVVSDWNSIGQLSTDYRAAVKQAINAGIDMSMVPDDWQLFESTLKSLVQSGDVPQSRVDDAVSRILRVKFEMGLFENPMPPAGKADSVGSDANRAVARQAVSESAVLLKTSGGLLPLARSGKVLVAGKGADDVGLASGGWTLSWQGQAGNVTTGTTLQAALSTLLGTNMSYSADGSFAAGTKAPVGIVVVSEPPYAEGVGDSATLTLPADDLAVIARVRPLVQKLVVIVYSGRPVMLDSFSGQADAIVAAWLPGTEAGPGLADVLFGDKPFTGTSPYTWPRTAADAPRYGKTACQGAVYLYGYGLDASGKLLGPAACS
jgi:beta-glucosidase